MLYKRISKGLTNYKLVPIDKFHKQVNRKRDEDWYYSLYDYEQSHFEQWKNTGSVAGINDLKTTNILFDLDGPTANSEVKILGKRLSDAGIPKDRIQFYFSGNKGFHIQVNLDTAISQKEFVNITKHYAQGLESFDHKIKDYQRLIRMPFSKHQESGLFKIAFDFDSIMSDEFDIESARSEAQDVTDNDYLLYNDWCDKKITPPIVKVKEMEKEEPTLDGRLDLTNKPTWLSETKYALQQGFFKEGERNTAFMILAATYRAQGWEKEHTWRILKGVAELQSKRNHTEEYPADKLWNEVISSVYSTNWKGGTYSETETTLLRKTAERYNLSITGDAEANGKSRLKEFDESFNRLVDYGKAYSQNKLITGFDSIDRHIVTMKGMVVGILGSAGSGKTTMVNNILAKNAKMGKKILFESLDMDENLMTYKSLAPYLPSDFDINTLLTSLESNKRTKEISEAFDKSQEIEKQITKNFSVSSVEDIEDDVIYFKSVHGQYPDIVVIDYLENVRGPYGDSHRDVNYIIPRITDLAKKYNTLVYLMLQPQKSAGDINKEIKSMRSIKGSSIIEQNLRLIFGLWRPCANRKSDVTDKFLCVKTLKNNIGPLKSFEFHFDGRANLVRELSSDEKFQLEESMKLIEKEESDSSEEWGF